MSKENFLERDLEDILYNTKSELIFNRGLDCFTHHQIYRQFKLGNYGIIDLMTVYYDGYIIINVYELKNRVLGASTFWQLLRYMRGVRHFSRNLNVKFHKIVINGIMIGRDVDMNGEFGFLPHLHTGVSIYTYDYNFDGITFERYYGANLKDPGKVSYDQLGFNSLFQFCREMKETYSDL